MADGTPERTFVSYIDRTREFYGAQGYDNAYRWAHFDTVPFTRLSRPLAECRVALVTTASPLRDLAPGKSRAAKTVWSASTESQPGGLFTDDLAWDKEATHTDDVGSFLPIDTVKRLAREGRIAGPTDRFHGVPTDYSQRRTLEQDAPEILSRVREDRADVALLIPL